ncbi:hypothetical protein F441_23052, partial [Phytophthora nicotianae CJ01A1]
ITRVTGHSSCNLGTLGYVPVTLPTRQELATSLLDNVYAEELIEVMDILRG